MSTHEPIGGQLWLRPGQPRPRNLRSTRPDWVGRLTRGLPASRLGPTLSSLFSLCGHAHRFCAGLAVQAALGRDLAPSPAARAVLAQQTLREHLGRIGLDWPRRLGARVADQANGARMLASCPAFAAVPSDPTAWVEAELTGMPLVRWLDGWEREPDAWLSQWAGQCDLMPARLLRGATGQQQTPVPLRLHADPATARAWADELSRGGASFAREPTWGGACAETGAWTRLAEADPRRFDTPALRLAARVAEVARLAQRDVGCLAVGALALAPGEAMAWVEMARGLLVHHVQLEGCGDTARVDACHVVAPTEWNFHPLGAVATVLESLPLDARGRPVECLMAAYDPCVPYRQESPVSQELVHA